MYKKINQQLLLILHLFAISAKNKKTLRIVRFEFDFEAKIRTYTQLCANTVKFFLGG